MQEISIRCGKGSCEFYDKDSKSKCSLVPDRHMCAASMEQHKKAKHHSKKRSETEIKY